MQENRKGSQIIDVTAVHLTAASVPQERFEVTPIALTNTAKLWVTRE